MGRTVSLGDHDTEEEAAHAFDRAAINKGGRAAKTNFPIVEYEAEVAELTGKPVQTETSRTLTTATSLPAHVHHQPAETANSVYSCKLVLCHTCYGTGFRSIASKLTWLTYAGLSQEELVAMLRSRARKNSAHASVYNGVSLIRQTGKWHAQIDIEGNQVTWQPGIAS